MERWFALIPPKYHLTATFYHITLTALQSPQIILLSIHLILHSPRSTYEVSICAIFYFPFTLYLPHHMWTSPYIHFTIHPPHMIYPLLPISTSPYVHFTKHPLHHTSTPHNISTSPYIHLTLCASHHISTSPYIHPTHSIYLLYIHLTMCAPHPVYPLQHLSTLPIVHNSHR